MTTIEQLRDGLIESVLMSSEEVERQRAQWRESTAGEGEAAEDFVAWLVERELLTEFQGDALLAGHTGPFMLGPYRVYEHLTSGRLGGIFRAVHEEFDQPVSLKVFPTSLKNDPENVARMGREARIFAELNHPHVVRSFHVGHVGGIYYLVLEDLHGETLQHRLDQGGRLPCRTACRLIRDVAKGLAHLHENQVIHRDLRPEAIWLTTDEVPKIREFGAALDALGEVDGIREDALRLTTSDTVLGQYDYMSPEEAQDARDADARSDIYALGCVFYHCLVGHPPFVEKNPIKLVLAHARSDPDAPSSLFDDIPEQVDETLSGMLAKDPDSRFQTASEVAFALDQYVGKEDEIQVAVRDVSRQYLDWIKSGPAGQAVVIPSDAVGVTPQLTEFLGWLSAREAKRRHLSH